MSELRKRGGKPTNPATAGWKRVTSKDHWTLYDRPRAYKNGWHSFVLRTSDKRFRKYSFWGGHNGQRLASNHDMKRSTRNTQQSMRGWSGFAVALGRL